MAQMKPNFLSLPLSLSIPYILGYAAFIHVQCWSACWIHMMEVRGILNKKWYGAFLIGNIQSPPKAQVIISDL